MCVCVCVHVWIQASVRVQHACAFMTAYACSCAYACVCHGSVGKRRPTLHRVPEQRPCPRRYFNCSSPGIQACSLPASCCIDPREDGASINDQCGSGALGLDEDAAQRVVHLEGCGTPLREWLRRNMRAVGGLAIAVVVVQGAELLLATRLVRALTVRKGAAESSGVGGAAAPVHPGRGPRDLPAPKSAPE